MIRAG